MGRALRTHSDNRASRDHLYQIAFDFVAQLEGIMQSEEIGRTELAQKLHVSKGRVSQILNNPGNLTLLNVVSYARALDLKVAIVAYNDRDTDRGEGPINPQVFVTCWEKTGKPTDLFSAIAVVAVSTQTEFDPRASWRKPRIPPNPAEEVATTSDAFNLDNYSDVPEELTYARTDPTHL